MPKGLTLIELLMTVVMLVILTAVIFYVLGVVLLSWSSQENRAGIDISLDRCMEEVVRDLREAKQVQSAAGYDEVRFTTDGAAYYIYYLYNTGDVYPPNFDQTAYLLKKTALTGGIGGTFTYGSGDIKASDLLPPPISDLSISGNMVMLDISAKRGDETIRSRTKVRPRNL